MFFPDGARTQLDLLEAAREPLNADTIKGVRCDRVLSLRESWAYNVRRDELRAGHHELMKSRGVDVIICPPYPGCAPLRNDMDWGCYTMLWNLFDLPALVFPTGLFVDTALDPIETEYQPANKYDRIEYEKCKLNPVVGWSRCLIAMLDDPEIFVGAPLCLQLVGKHFQDEETLAAARIIEKIILV